MNVEDRIFELFGDETSGVEVVDAVVAEYDMDRRAAWDLVVRVHRERGSPLLVRIEEAIAELGRISYI